MTYHSSLNFLMKPWNIAEIFTKYWEILKIHKTRKIKRMERFSRTKASGSYILDVLQINRTARFVGVIEFIFAWIHSTPSSVSKRIISGNKVRSLLRPGPYSCFWRVGWRNGNIVPGLIAVLRLLRIEILLLKNSPGAWVAVLITEQTILILPKQNQLFKSC